MSLIALLLCGGSAFGSIAAIAIFKLPRVAATALTLLLAIGAIVFLEWAVQ